MTRTAAPAPKKRGRPRAFDANEVLARATETFFRLGYTGATLDALAESMGLNKPSLYAAFGDKRRLFFRALEALITVRGQRYRAAFDRGHSLEASLSAMLDEGVDINTEPPLIGCLVVNVSTAEALVDEELAKFTREFFDTCDEVLARWIEKRYEVRKATSHLVARLTNAIIHDISLRARVGESPAKLREHARSSARMLAQLVQR